MVELQESFAPAGNPGFSDRLKSSELCRKSDELLRKSRQLRDRLKRVSDAS